jgi:hypothetical protein
MHFQMYGYEIPNCARLTDFCDLKFSCKAHIFAFTFVWIVVWFQEFNLNNQKHDMTDFQRDDQNCTSPSDDYSLKSCL